ncbi:GGDEF domain-containing response regulator [Oscillatoria sp. FACHB-1406]|uniref:putative bifunctional diguanylate cyclase/phosphodiesterase n=1 Tax=Oscillatoria sp. FACHB-1406 TaxID=2692846 RepID=UPI0016877C82|nr:GGDEF domain-containing response regulator [Oscillatoria sp. FACHB-1406]MBD2576127.1 EAL domain-containing protein [Oscillatoria sp. FACHB-1406]
MNSTNRHPYKADILVVDDTQENLSFLSSMLAQQGYDVRIAINGEMGLLAATTVVPDLILLDIMMPGIDGYEVCRRLKTAAETASVPIIFLSALSSSFDKVQAFTAGGVDYITKPFQVEEVLARIQNQLNLRAALQEVVKLNNALERRVEERTQQLEAAHMRLLEVALRDTLTGLPNRIFFLKHLQAALERAKTEAGYSFAVLFLDCDRFKIVNNSFGHPVGDKLLCDAARRLETCLEPQHSIARLGGDEFAILLSGIKSYTDAIAVAERLLQSFAQPFEVLGLDVFISASIGIVLSDRGYEQPEHMLRDADTAMYQAKAQGKDCYQIFEPAMHANAIQFFEIERDLRAAIAGNALEQFIVRYQPIVSLATGKIAGFEALVRWQHPTRGLVSPVEFIHVAEETSLIGPIGYWVLQESCRQLRAWQEGGFADASISVSVNLSARQFAQPNLIDKIDSILEKTHLSPKNLKLEITESAIMENPQTASTILKQLRARKIQLSIDDFGTGYSSLSYLHAFPVDTLKIDKSFVQRLDNNSKSLGLIPAMISIARTMKMDVVAEGIETPQQLALLRELDCDFSQGYLFAPPLEVDKAVDFMLVSPEW